jgi:hypothetical protein
MTIAAALATIATLTATASAADFSANSDLTAPSGLTAEQIEFLTTAIRRDSGLAGLGDSIAEAEATYGVNALFILAVASQESGYGLSAAARNRNNLFGIMGRNGQVNFSNKHDSVMGFARLISGRLYFGATRTTPRGINAVYAPNNSEWTTKIVRFMNEYSRLMSDFVPEPPTPEAFEAFNAFEPLEFRRLEMTPPPPKRRDTPEPLDTESEPPESEDIPEIITITLHFSSEPLTKSKKRGTIDKVQ